MRIPALAAVLLALAVSACHTSVLEPLTGTTDPTLLQGEPWSLAVVTSEGDSPRPVSVELTLAFERSRLGGKAGPNSYGGDYEVDEGGRLEIVELVSTLIGGPEAEVTGALLAKLGRATAFEGARNRLRIRTLDGTVLDFKR